MYIEFCAYRVVCIHRIIYRVVCIELYRAVLETLSISSCQTSLHTETQIPKRCDRQQVLILSLSLSLACCLSRSLSPLHCLFSNRFSPRRDNWQSSIFNLLSLSLSLSVCLSVSPSSYRPSPSTRDSRSVREEREGGKKKKKRDLMRNQCRWRRCMRLYLLT